MPKGQRGFAANAPIRLCRKAVPAMHIGKILNITNDAVDLTPEEAALRWDALLDHELRKLVDASTYQTWHWALAQNDDEALGVTEVRKRLEEFVRKKRGQ